MQIIYPYQVRFAIDNLTTIAEDLEFVESPDWHVFASAAACLESLIHGVTPADIDQVSARLRAFPLPNPGARLFGKKTFLAVSMAITIIDGHRFGLLTIQRAITPDFWIGIDMGTGDRTVFHTPQGGRHHAN